MSTKLITAPTVEPLSLNQAKLHLRVDATEDDDLIQSLITAAREWAEEILARALITQTWDLVLDAWPADNVIKIPRPPLQSVTHVKYYGTAGGENTLSSSSYIVDSDRAPGRIALAYGSSWPSTTLQPANGIRIQYVAGYGDQAADVPERIIAAIKLLLGHLYEHREAVMADARLREIPMGAKRLLNLDRVVKV